MSKYTGRPQRDPLTGNISKHQHWWLKRDPLTGNVYGSELSMYVRYHGLSLAEAEAVMTEVSSYAARDRVFSRIVTPRVD